MCHDYEINTPEQGRGEYTLIWTMFLLYSVLGCSLFLFLFGCTNQTFITIFVLIAIIHIFNGIISSIYKCYIEPSSNPRKLILIIYYILASLLNITLGIIGFVLLSNGSYYDFAIKQSWALGLISLLELLFIYPLVSKFIELYRTIFHSCNPRNEYTFINNV